MKPNHTRNSHARSLQIRHTPSNPIRPHAHGRETVDSGFCAQVVDLRGRGVEFEESVVDGGWDGLGEGVYGFSAAATVGVVDGGDGGGDYGGPFCVGVAVCHFGWRWWCLVGSEVRGVGDQRLIFFLSFRAEEEIGRGRPR